MSTQRSRTDDLIDATKILTLGTVYVVALFAGTCLSLARGALSRLAAPLSSRSETPTHAPTEQQPR